MARTLPLLLGVLILLLLGLATRSFRVKLDARRLTLLVAVSLLLGYMLFYTALWRLLFSTVKFLSCTSALGIIAIAGAIFLAARGARGRG